MSYTGIVELQIIYGYSHEYVYEILTLHLISEV